MTVQELLRRADIDVIYSILMKHYMDKNYMIKKYKEKNPTTATDETILKEIMQKEYDSVKKGYDDLTHLKSNKHSNTYCVVIRYYTATDDENVLEDLIYDVTSIEKEKLLASYEEIDTIETYEEFTDIIKIRKPIETYNFMYVKREDVLGYEVSPLSIEMYGVNEVAASVFWELTWFGYDNDTANKNQETSILSLESNSKELADDLFDFEEDLEEISNYEKKKTLEELISEAEKKEIILNFNIKNQYFKKLLAYITNSH